MTRLSGTILAVTAMAYPALAARQPSIRAYTPAAQQASSGNSVTSNVLSLKKGKKAAKSAGHLGTLRSNVSSSSKHRYGAEPVDDLGSVEYVAEIEWDGTPVEVIVDTGSSDTWLVQAGFTCVDVDGNVQPVCASPPPPFLAGSTQVGIAQHIDALLTGGRLLFWSGV